MNPWIIFAALIALVGWSGYCYQTGGDDARNACAAQALKVERLAHVDYVAGVRRAVDQANKIAEQNAEVEKASTQRRAEIRRVYQTIDHEVIKYVQTDAGHGLCFDDDGLRLYNAANRGESPAKDSATPGAVGHGAVPGISPPSGERQPGGDPANEQDVGAGVLPVPGSTAGAGRLDTAQP